MKMEIILNDYSGEQMLVLRNSEKPNYVFVGSCEVNIEELKLALRKISLK